MNNPKCKAFLECVECGSITSAADKLGYTPSAISQLVSGLEKELGIKLLNRSQKGVVLTTEGRAILPVIRSYLAQEEEVARFAEELKGVTTGKVSIAAYPSIAISWLPAIVRQFKKDYPGVQIGIMERIREDIFHDLDQSVADIGLLAYAEPMPYEWIPLSETAIIAAVPEDHPLANAGSFPIKECENNDFILGSWGNEKEILDIFKKYNVYPEIKYTTYDTPATLAMVRMNLGISFVNELSAQFWNENLVKMPLDPPEKIELGIAIPSRDNMTNAARKFMEYVMDYFDK